VPETFDSNIGDEHERERLPDRSFSNEFLGASDSLIERDRPARQVDVARRSRRGMYVLMLLAALLGGGGWAFWYWSQPIGEWIASWGAREQPKPAPVEEPEPAPAQPEPAPPEPAPPEPEPVPEPTAPETPPPRIDPPVSGELPVEPLDIPTAAASVAIGATSVRGQVSSATVGSRLAAVDTALGECWTTEAAKPETKRPTTVTLRFGIKWNGKTFGVTVEGDVPKAISSCVRTALPTAGWPQPRDGGEATVSRSWTLE
jgi:hypothetical protein